MPTIAFAITILTLLLLSFTPSDALTVQFYKCSNTSCSSITSLGALGGSTNAGPLNIANSNGWGGKLVVSGSTAQVAIAQTTSVKNVRLSGVFQAKETGTYLVRILSDNHYAAQPGGTNYNNAVSLNGAWIGTGDFRANRIEVILTANFGTSSATSVDQAPASPTVVVQYASDNKSFFRSANTKQESIFLPNQSLTCTDSTGRTINTCGRNRHRKDVRITFSQVNQTVNMGESVFAATSQSPLSEGGRAETNRFLLCGETSDQFQVGTTEAERAYVVFPQTPLTSNPERPRSNSPTFPVSFTAKLPASDGSSTLESFPKDTDPSNDRQFNLFLPCGPVTFQGLTNLVATFPNGFTIDGVPSDACKGTLRWVLALFRGTTRQTVQVLYGDPGSSFDNCEAYSGVNMMETGDARFLVDGSLKTRNQVNSLNNYTVERILLLLDGALATGVPANQESPLDITVKLTSMQVNNDLPISFASQPTEVPICPPAGPGHGFEILITNLDDPNFLAIIPQDRVSTSGCKISVNASSTTDFGGSGRYMVEVLNNNTPLDHPGFLSFGP